MKIKSFISSLGERYNFKLKIIKKGIFWILIDEDAFFMAKVFNMKITILDKETIKVGFPDGSKNKWLKIFKEKKLSYFLFEKNGEDFLETENFFGSEYTKFFLFDLEDYNLTKDRILGLNKMGFEDKNESNFLLKDKVEDVYIIIFDLLLRLPRKERYFIRERIERLFLDVFEDIYSYMYNFGNRQKNVESMFNKSMILREYFRLLYKMGKIKNNNVYLDLGNRWVEVLKICKGLRSKYVDIDVEI